MAMRWKREPKLTGLAAVGATPRGSFLHDGTLTYATTSAIGGGYKPFRGWFWVAGWDSNIPYKNTCNTPLTTEEEAKAEAKAYVMEQLKELI